MQDSGSGVPNNYDAVNKTGPGAKSANPGGSGCADTVGVGPAGPATVTPSADVDAAEDRKPGMI